MTEESRTLWSKLQEERQGFFLMLFVVGTFLGLADMAAEENNDVLLFAQLVVAVLAGSFMMYFSRRYSAARAAWCEHRRLQGAK
jgi:hypothetical protein